MTLEAQKILSCIYRTKEAFGESVLIDILRGFMGQRLKNISYTSFQPLE